MFLKTVAITACFFLSATGNYVIYAIDNSPTMSWLNFFAFFLYNGCQFIKVISIISEFYISLFPRENVISNSRNDNAI